MFNVFNITQEIRTVLSEYLQYNNTQMNFAGIDENGLGPLMGPLIITGVCAKGKEENFSWFPDIEDSKTFFNGRNEKNYKKIEEISLSLFLSVYNYLPKNPLSVITAVSDIKCETKKNFCLEEIPFSFLWADLSKVEEKADEIKNWMKEKNFFITDIKCKIFCPFQINKFFEKNYSKSFVDFIGFSEIIEKFKKEKIKIYAGKIGGMKNYFPFLKYKFPDWDIYKIQETEKCSLYKLKQKNYSIQIGFYLDVEKVSFLASFSSIFGKYIREIFIHGINKKLGTKEVISGYRDKKTSLFISRNIFLLKSINIPEMCILRKK